MTRIERVLRSNPHLLVLFISDPENGDQFLFGTHEELQNELEAAEETPAAAAELATAGELADRLDFSVYEDNEPTISQ